MHQSMVWLHCPRALQVLKLPSENHEGGQNGMISISSTSVIASTCVRTNAVAFRDCSVVVREDAMVVVGPMATEACILQCVKIRDVAWRGKATCRQRRCTTAKNGARDREEIMGHVGVDKRSTDSQVRIRSCSWAHELLPVWGRVRWQRQSEWYKYSILVFSSIGFIKCMHIWFVWCINMSEDHMSRKNNAIRLWKDTWYNYFE
jgi:hypothetical protein